MPQSSGGERFTLEEARLELAKQECSRYGHSYDVVVSMGSDGPTTIQCDRCGKAWDVLQ